MLIPIKLPAPTTITTTTGATISGIPSVCFNGKLAAGDYTNIGADTRDFTLDYGENHLVTEIKWWMYYDGRIFRNVALYASTDGTNWDTLRGPANWVSNSAGITVTLGTPTEYRYFRFYCEGNAEYNSNEYCEIEIYKNLEVSDDGDLAQGKTASADSEITSEYVAEYAVDGNDATRWCSAVNTNASWWSVDLGADYKIALAVLKWENGNAAVYDIQYSDDNVNWTTAATFTFASWARTDRITWEQETAHRYWKIDTVTIGAATASLWTVNLYELTEEEPPASTRRFAQII